MITIVNYGLGNIKAFANVYKNLDIPHTIATHRDELKNASQIILPGVGAFDHAISLLNKSGMRETLDNLVLELKIPVLGICVGMQIMAKSSEEGKDAGLGWIDATVKKIPNESIALPHMGWNSIESIGNPSLFNQVNEQHGFYFLHSYYFECNDSSDVLASVEYGDKFTCAVNSENINGVQFHPEKSHSNGVQLLKNLWDVI